MCTLVRLCVSLAQLASFPPCAIVESDEHPLPGHAVMHLLLVLMCVDLGLLLLLQGIATPEGDCPRAGGSWSGGACNRHHVSGLSFTLSCGSLSDVRGWVGQQGYHFGPSLQL